MKVTYDLNDDAPRYVIEALMAVDRPLSSYDLADNYDPPKPNNLAELRNEYRDESGDVGRIGDYDVKEWLIVNAVQEINDCNDGPEQGDSIIVDEESDGYRLADCVDANQLQVGGERLIRTRALPDLFTPETGVWADNIRSYSPEGLKELRESMGQLGWLRQLPAIADENGVVIVGHRRLAVAEELGIDPVIETVRFGEGVAADAARTALAIASNVGAEKISAADRKKIAADLYGSGWSMAKIGELLKVATMTVSRDLRGLTVLNPKPQRGGRPRKKPKPIDEDPIAEQPITTEPPGGVTENTPGQTVRMKRALEIAKAATDAAEPAPDDSDTGPDLGIALSGIAADLDKLADYVTALDTDPRLKVLDDHFDAINDVSRKLQRMIKPLRAAQKIRAQEKKG